MQELILQMQMLQNKKHQHRESGAESLQPEIVTSSDAGSRLRHERQGDGDEGCYERCGTCGCYGAVKGAAGRRVGGASEGEREVVHACVVCQPVSGYTKHADSMRSQEELESDGGGMRRGKIDLARGRHEEEEHGTAH